MAEARRADVPTLVLSQRVLSTWSARAQPLRAAQDSGQTHLAPLARPTFSIARSFEATLSCHRPAPVTGTVTALYSSPRWVFIAPDPRNGCLFLPTNLFHQICRQCRVRQSRREEVWRL